MKNSANNISTSSNVPSSSSVDKTFKKREGTTNVGHNYENALLANIVLNQPFDDKSNDFLVWSNDKEFGDFDDVILQSDTSCAIQLKHVSKKKSLTLDSLKADTGDFSIKKFFKSFIKFEDSLSNYNLILFTNLKFTPHKNQEFSLCDEETFKLQIVEVDANPVINTQEKQKKCFKFKIVEENWSKKLEDYKKFLEKFFVYANQLDVDHLEKRIYQQMKIKFFCENDASKMFLNFFANWNLTKKVKIKLDKAMMKRLLALYLVSTKIHPISRGKLSENRKILQEAMSQFHITTFEQGEWSQNIWVDSNKVDANAANITNKNYQISKLSFEEFGNSNITDYTKLLWLMNKCPLIVEESPEVDQALKLCNDRSFVVLTKDKNTNLEGYSIFSKLSDLQGYPKLLDMFLCNFKFLLFEKEITLKQIENEELQGNITTNELLWMLDKPYEIKQELEEISDSYIQRHLTRNIIDFKFLDEIKEDTVVFISNVKDVEQLKKYNAVSLKKYLKNTSNEPQIVFTSKDQISEIKFHHISEKKSNTSHHFKMADGRLEWIRSSGNISDLKKYCVKGDSIKEDNLTETNYKDNIYLVVGDPGLGKSWFLKSLKNKFSTNTIVTMFTPQDMQKIYDYIKKDKDNLDDFIMNLKFSYWKKLDRCVVKQLIHQNQAIYLWDALDEIVSDEARNMILEIVKKNSERGIVQWITCRRHLETTLQKQFNVLSRTLVEFNTTEQSNYIKEKLKSVWSNQDECEELVNKILSSVIISKYREIIGIPLQIHMLTEICFQNKNRILDIGAFSLANLYEYFVEEKFNFYYKKFGNIPWKNFKHEQNAIIKEFEIAALKTILEDDFFNMLEVNIAEDLDEFGNKFGFITEFIENNSKSTIKFSHISYAEYFVASYLARETRRNKRKQSIIKRFISKKKYENVRFFLDLILAKNCPAHIAVLYNDLEKLKSCEKDIKLKDAWGRNPLHLACSWGGKWKVLDFKINSNKKYFILETYQTHLEKTPLEHIEIIEELVLKCDTHKTDQFMKMNTLQYAEKYNSMFALATIEEKCKTKYLDLTDDRFKCNILFYSVMFNLKQFIPLLQPYVNRIILGNEKNTLLHFACKNGYEKVVQELIKVEVDINASRKDGVTPLMLACQNGNKQIVEMLMKAKVVTDASDKNGKTPIMFACENGHEEVVTMLMKAGFNINASKRDGVTPFMLACQNGNKQIVEMLMKAEVKINTFDKDDRTPFMFACENGHEEVVKILMNAGVNINASRKDGVTPFMLACQNGNKQIVEMLMKAEVKINTFDKDDRTPFMFACENGHEEVVTMLMKAGVNINASKRDGVTPFMLACQNGNKQIVEMLMKAEVKINTFDKDDRTPFMFACENGHEEVVKILMNAGVNINASRKDGVTPFMLACQNGNKKIVEMLMKAKANINASDKEGRTPFLFACKNEHEEIVKKLIYAGVNISASKKDGVTPFMLACQNGNKLIVEMLMKVKVDIHASDKDGRTPFMFACENGNKEVVTMLINAGVDINAADKDGWTPFMAACFMGQEKVAEILINTGTDINVANVDGITPLMMACQTSQVKVVEILVNAGADINANKKNGWTPFMIACQTGNEIIVEILIEAKTDLDTSDKHGWTPFMIASANGHKKIVKMVAKALYRLQKVNKNDDYKIESSSSEINVMNNLSA